MIPWNRGLQLPDCIIDRYGGFQCRSSDSDHLPLIPCDRNGASTAGTCKPVDIEQCISANNFMKGQDCILWRHVPEGIKEAARERLEERVSLQVPGLPDLRLLKSIKPHSMS